MSEQEVIEEVLRLRESVAMLEEKTKLEIKQRRSAERELSLVRAMPSGQVQSAQLARDLRAERDAALAAIERVREAHRKFTYYELEDSCPDTSEDHREERHHESDEIGEFYCEDMPTGDVVCDLCRDVDGERMDWPCPTIQALDGAPEPEWEYAREYRDEAGYPTIRKARDITTPDGHRSDGSPYWNYQVLRRRKAGPWLPVEGEKP